MPASLPYLTRETVLSDILKVAPYDKWTRTGSGRLGLGEWRDKNWSNPHLKLDALGLYDFKAEKSISSLWQLARNVGLKDIPEPVAETPEERAEQRKRQRREAEGEKRKSAEKRIAYALSDDSEWERWQFPVIEYYFETVRGIPVSRHMPSRWERERFYRSLEIYLASYTDEKSGEDICEICIPMRGKGRELVQLMRIGIDENCQKINKKLSFSQCADRAIVFGCRERELLNETVIVEGIEDALSIYFGLFEQGGARCKFMVVGPTSGYAAIGDFVGQARKSGERLVVIADNDELQVGLTKTLCLGEEIERWLPGVVGLDANAALREGTLPQWFAGLQYVSYARLEEETNREARAEIAGAERDPFDFHRRVNSCTDAGAAQFFIERFGKVTRITENGQFWIWTGKAWVTDHAESVIKREVSSLAVLYFQAAEKITSDSDKARGEKQKLRAFAESLGEAWRQRSVSQVLAGHPSIMCALEQFDQRADILNVRNGVLELDTGKLLPHAPEFLCSKLARASWNPEAECPLFDGFIERFFPDHEMMSYKLRQWGYLISGYVGEKAFFFHYGEQGDNGKSKEAEILHYLLGDYAREVSPTVYTEQRNSNETAYTMAGLRGTRLIISGELSDGMVWDEAAIKRFTGGGDRITARSMRSMPFEFQPRFKPVVHANNKPNIKVGDKALWKRINLVPYEIQIPKAEQDQDFGEKLKLEADGILNRLWMGYREWRAGGLEAPACVLEAKEEYKAEVFSDISEFIDEQCVTGKDRVCLASELYDAYRGFCESKNRRPRSLSAFGRFIGSLGYSLGRTCVNKKDKKTREGIAIKSDFDVNSNDDKDDNEII